MLLTHLFPITCSPSIGQLLLTTTTTQIRIVLNVSRTHLVNILCANTLISNLLFRPYSDLIRSGFISREQHNNNHIYVYIYVYAAELASIHLPPNVDYVYIALWFRKFFMCGKRPGEAGGRKGQSTCSWENGLFEPPQQASVYNIL